MGLVIVRARVGILANSATGGFVRVEELAKVPFHSRRVTDPPLSESRESAFFYRLDSLTAMLILKGMLLGILNATPVGPVGLLCLRQNMVSDRWPGLFAGAGMAFAYGIIAFCVVFGLKAISGFLHDHETSLQIAAGLLLIAMGWSGLRPARAALPQNPPRPVRYLGDFSTSFAMTLFNPVPFATFTVILTSFQVFKGQPDLGTDLLFAASVLLGTLLFWVVVNEALHHVKKRSPEMLSRRVANGTSIALLVFGVILAGKGIF